MLKEHKETVIAELTARLRTTDALIVADYRGLTMPQIDALRSTLLEHGARFTVVKNTLTRRAASEAGVDALLAMLEGPSAIAFIESEGSIVEVAKALSESARTTRVLAIRGGLMQGRTITADDVDELAKLPPFDVLRGQVLAAIIGPLSSLIGLVSAPLQNLVGLIDARIEQLGGVDAASAAADAEPALAAAGDGADAPAAEPAPESESAVSEAEPSVEADAEPSAEAEPRAEAEADASADAEPEASAEAEPAEAEAEPELPTESDDQEVDDDGGS
jgi:large subunit ribosomal protein L10